MIVSFSEGLSDSEADDAEVEAADADPITKRAN